MDFTDWLKYEYSQEINDDYDYFLARQEWKKTYRPSLFFIGLNPRWQMYKFLPKNLNVMYSAFGFWDNNRREWRKGYKFKRNFGLKWLDCGGFTALNNYNDYPFSVVNYANLIARLRPDYYATMDYPCEPEISRSLSLMTNGDRIKTTVENAVKLSEYEKQLPGIMVPIIQGYTLEEYLHCLHLHGRAGTIRDYMAVGSMCRRISNDELSKLIPGIYYAAQKAGCSKLHFFGLKLSAALEPYHDMIWSRDSAVIFMSASKKLRKQMGGRRFPKGQKEKKMVFYDFLAKVNNMGLNYAKN